MKNTALDIEPDGNAHELLVGRKTSGRGTESLVAPCEDEDAHEDLLEESSAGEHGRPKAELRWPPPLVASCYW